MKNLNEFINEALDGAQNNSINEAKYDGDLSGDLEELCNMNFNLNAVDDKDETFDEIMDYWDAIFYCAKTDLSKFALKSGYNFKRTGLEDEKGKEYLVFKNDDEEWYGSTIIPMILAHYGTEIRPEFADLIDKDWKKSAVKKNFKKLDL